MPGGYLCPTMNSFSSAHISLPSKWTKELVSSYINEEEVFAHLGLPVEEPIGTRFCSPFRTDTHPDCKLIFSKEGKLRFYDPAMGESLDWISLVMYSQSLSFQGALDWVADTFSLEGKKESKPTVFMEAAKRKAPAAATIQVRFCPLSWKDKLWWQQFNVSEQMLLDNNVFAISDYWLNGRHHYCPKGQLAFCYREADGYKLYFPEEDRKWKWRSTTKVLSCYETLPQTGDLLVITSSKKDALCLKSFGYNVIAPQGEGMDIPSGSLWELKLRFKRLVIFYDNDYPGLQLAHQKRISWQVDDFVYLPFTEEAKDPAAYCQLYGAEAAQTIFNTLLSPC